MLRIYIPTILDADLRNEFIRKLFKYEREVQRVVSTSRFGPSCDNSNSFALVPGGRGENGGL